MKKVELKDAEDAIRIEAGAESALQQQIQRAFELELQMKYQELESIQQNIHEGLRTMKKLWNCMEMEKEQRNHRLENPIPKAPAPKSQSNCVYALRSDGHFVRLKCPVCQRQDFQNRIGFINHCRYSHQLTYSSMEEWSTHCGIIVENPDQEIPESDPCRQEKVVANLVELDELNPGATSADPQISNHTKQFITYNSGTTTHIAPTDIPLTCLGLPSRHLPAPESRFYIKRRIVVGNVSKFIPKSERGMDHKLSHKWMVYVYPGDNHRIDKYIDRVIFHLHPSYRPADRVEVTESPYQIVRHGWGEFPIRVEVHFRNEDVNQVVNIIHLLKLDQSRCGRQVQGPERAFDVELDRATFEDMDDLISDTTSPSNSERSESTPEPSELSPDDNMSGHESDGSFMIEDPLKTSRPASHHASPAKPMIPVRPILNETSLHCRYCGRHRNYHPIAQEIMQMHDQLRHIDSKHWPVNSFSLELSALKELSVDHDEMKCQFKSMNRKGKVKNLFSSLSCYLELVNQEQKVKTTPNDVLKEKLERLVAQLRELDSVKNSEDPMEIDENRPPEITEPEPGAQSEVHGNKEVDFKQEQKIVPQKRSFQLIHYMSAMHQMINGFSHIPKQLPSRDVSMNEPQNQVPILFLALTRNFIRKLVSDSLEVVSMEEEAETEDFNIDRALLSQFRTVSQVYLNKNAETQETEGETKEDGTIQKRLLTPYHIQRAVYAHRGRWDFLSNRYLEKKNQKSEPKKKKGKDSENAKNTTEDVAEPISLIEPTEIAIEPGSAIVPIDATLPLEDKVDTAMDCDV